MVLLAASLVLITPPLERLITFDEPAMPLSRLLPALGAEVGVEVVASRTVAKDVALVRVREKPLGEVLSHLAEEDGAEIEKTKSGFRIVRTAGSERKELAASLRKRRETLVPGIEATRRSLDMPADAAAYRVLLPALKTISKSAMGWVRSGAETPRSRLPATRAAMRGLLSLPVDLLASLHEGDRHVYSNFPTRLQTHLPALNEIMKRFQSEQNAWSRIAQSTSVEPSRYADDPFRHVDPLDGPPNRAVLIVSRSNSADAAMARIVLLDAAGNEIATSGYGLQSTGDTRALAALHGPAEKPVPMCSETKILLDGVPRLDGTGPATASAAAVALLREPERRDPLSFGATDLVRDLAGDGPIMAVLPDTAWLVGLVGRDGLTRRDRAFLAATADVRIEGGWTLVRPLDPAAARTGRVDRSILGHFVRTMVSSGRVPLDAYATYAFNASDAPSDVVGVFVAMMIGQGAFNPDVDWQALRLYGSLSASDHKMLLAGGRKTWATLSARQRTLAAMIVSKRITSYAREVSGGRVLAPSLIMEPTEVFADGYDALSVSLTSKTDEPLFCDSTTNPHARGWRRYLDPKSAGRAAAQADGPAFDRFGVARRTSYTLQLSAKRGTGSGALLEDLVPPQRPLQTIETLPDAIRIAFARGKESATREIPGG